MQTGLFWINRPWGFTSPHDMTGVLGLGDPLCFRTYGAMFCRCPVQRGVFSVMNITIYPQLGMMGSRETGLLDMKHIPWGNCFWNEALRQPFGVQRIKIWKAPTVPMGWGNYIQFEFTGMDHDGTPMACSWLCRAFGCRNQKSLMAHLLIIQGAVRTFVRRRREKRALAVVMGLHERLGQFSHIQTIPVDLLAAKIIHVQASSACCVIN